MANGKLMLAGVFVVSAAVGVVPLFLHDRAAVAGRVGEARLESPRALGGSQGNTAGAAVGGQLGQFGDKSLERDSLSGEEKMKLYEAENTYYNAIEEVLVQRYLKDFFTDFQQKNSLPDQNAAQQKFFESKITVAQAEVDKFLEENKENPGLQKIPEGERRNQIRSYLEGRARQGVMRDLVSQARASGQVKVAMAKPVEPKLDVQIGNNVALGASDAKVTIVEFADYQCPFCARMIPGMKDLLKKYDGKVKWVYRDFPLKEIHPEATPAAIASTCAQQQGKFWESHGYLFERYQTLGDPVYASMVKDLGLDEAKFAACRKDPAVAADVDADLADGSKYGVQGTPTYFVNGRKAPGDMAEMARLVDEELAKL